MPKYTLTYFDLRARAEISRLILKQAGVDFVDNRIQRENWPELKQTVPFGQLPMLEVDGVKFCQSIAIARYLAKEVGLAGDNNLECAKIDFIADCIVDFGNKFMPTFREKDEAKKAELLKAFKEEAFPAFVKNLTSELERNGGEWLSGKLSWVDLFIFDVLTFMSHIYTNLNENLKTLAPKLAEHSERVGNLPNIKKWVESRPQNPF